MSALTITSESRWYLPESVRVALDAWLRAEGILGLEEATQWMTALTLGEGFVEIEAEWKATGEPVHREPLPVRTPPPRCVLEALMVRP